MDLGTLLAGAIGAATGFYLGVVLMTKVTAVADEKSDEDWRALGDWARSTIAVRRSG